MGHYDCAGSTAEQSDQVGPEAPGRSAAGPAAGSARGPADPLAERSPLGTLSPAGLLALQRTAGNAAVAAIVQRSKDGVIPIATAAARIRSERAARRPPLPLDAHFRLPAPEELKRIWDNGTVPNDVVKESVERALKRMDKDVDLRTGASDVMSKLFPNPGTFDPSAWNTVLGTDTDDVYKSAADAEAKLKPEDKARLAGAAKDAEDEIDKAMADAAGLTGVFGSKAALAKQRYGKAKAALIAAIANADKAFDTDYNRDDPQTGLGGWASFSQKHVHLTLAVAQVTDHDDSVITLVHESCHLGNPEVIDLGYYASDGFEAMSEDDKVNNAAHYEELIARSLGVSKFATTKFTPGVTASGGAVTFEDEVRRAASEYLRKAWDAAVDAHQFVRNAAKDIIASPAAGVFKARKSSLLEISKFEHLTIHRQTPAPATVTTLDLVLSEGVAHATSKIQDEASNEPVPAPADKKLAVNAVIDGAIASYGELLGTPADSRKLIDWLVSHYQKGF